MTNPRLSVEEILELDRELHPKGNWEYEPCGQSIWCKESPNYMVADVRGWGHLTGGASLKLRHKDAKKIQDATGEYIAAMPDAVAHLKLQQQRIQELEKMRDTLYDAIAHGDDAHKIWLRDAIEKHFNQQKGE